MQKSPVFKKEFIILLLIGLLLLGVSYLTPKPATITELVNQAKALPPNNELNIMARANIGFDYDKKIYEDTKKAVIKSGNLNYALAFLTADSFDGEIMDKFENQIDKTAKHFILGNKIGTRDILLYSQVYDDVKEEKFEKLALKNKQPENFLLYYVLGNDFFPNYDKLPEPKSVPGKTVYFVLKKPFIQDFFGFRSKAEIGAVDKLLLIKPKNQQHKVQQLLATQQYYHTAYTPMSIFGVVKDGGFGPSIFFIFTIIIPLITSFTLKGKDSKTLFRKESSDLQLKATILGLLFIQAWFNFSAYLPIAFFWRILLVVLIGIAVAIIPTKVYFRLKREYGLINENFDKKKYILRSTMGPVLILALGAIYFAIVFGGVTLILPALPKGLPDAVYIFAVLALIGFAVLLQAMLAPYFIGLAMFARKLEDAELNERFQELGQRFGFSSCKIFIVPSFGVRLVNAMQTGLFKRNLRIYLFETLLDKTNFTEREMEAVLAHELAHIKRKHILKLVFIPVGIYSLLSATSFFIEDHLASSMKTTAENIFPILIIGGTFLLLALIQRKFEFQADNLAAKYGYQAELISALDKLHEINLTPKKLPRILYAFQSHGDFEARKARLMKTKEEIT